jgi:hypothetical protein
MYGNATISESAAPQPHDGVPGLKSGLELFESRVDEITLSEGVATVHFSHAYIYKTKGTPGQDPGTGWSQEALLILSKVSSCGPLPKLPAMISDGFLEVGGVRHTLLPLPFERRVDATLQLIFNDGTELEIRGTRPTVELLGKPIYLEDIE